jgi:hypothetical protein
MRFLRRGVTAMFAVCGVALSQNPCITFPTLQSDVNSASTACAGLFTEGSFTEVETWTATCQTGVCPVLPVQMPGICGGCLGVINCSSVVTSTGTGASGWGANQGYFYVKVQSPTPGSLPYIGGGSSWCTYGLPVENDSSTCPYCSRPGS